MISAAFYNDPQFPERFAQGEENAFRQVFDTYLNPLCFFAQKLIGSRMEAEDIVSIAYYKLWQRHKDFSTAAGIRSFLYTTVRNQCLDYLKHQKVVAAAHLPNPLTDSGIEAKMYQGELLQLIYMEIHSLPERARQILEWSFIEELSTTEISVKMQMTESHVRVEKSRALVQLRAALRKKDLWDSTLLLALLWQSS
ncbi:RNA polymerase sigma factor [Pseudobacter ginsenosidimutans]|uniref:RNA polymerase sigma-70 factor (ECF subfamily) n=1 Tax=Pseudobacter ginsenosidimutans TaxID=661488 RepID=A0A4Q7N6D0_9BACT|nr:sigma-70 family RNA polymerase sigma factor [Pseudobacter ginsenosidimutans]RZS76645.1 RNA polymerase sigma-70 factor (ECF subfamily) [Pseudobacter ginsenosidimutans]